VRFLLMLAVMTPMLTGIVVRTYAWMTLLSDAGVINSALLSLGLISGPLKLMYNEFGIVVALVHIYMPFMVLSLIGVISKIDLNIEQSAANLGAVPWRVFVEVTLPLSLPGIAAGSLLVFAMAVSAYVTPALMGSMRIITLPILIYQQIGGTFDPYYASTLGILLLLLALLILCLHSALIAKLSPREQP
jgi:putative spermidine/putrescine transport system permease protein